MMFLLLALMDKVFILDEKVTKKAKHDETWERHFKMLVSTLNPKLRSLTL